jgi:hypothetical protein
MINPYILIALIVSFVLSNGYAYHTGGNHMKNSIKAEQLEANNEAIVLAEVQATEDSTLIRVVEVEKEVVRNVYIKVRDKVNENIENNPNYAECSLDADGLRLFNSSAATYTTITREPTH